MSCIHIDFIINQYLLLFRYNAGTANLALLVKSFLYIAHLNFPISSNIPLNIFKDNKNAHWQFYGIRKTFNATSLVISEYYSHKFHPATRHQEISSFWVNFFQHSPVPLGASDVTAWCWKTLEENWSFAQNETCALASRTSHHLNPVSIVVITDFTPYYIL